MSAPIQPVVLLPCPFCGDVGRCGPDGAYYFEHAQKCWIRSQRGSMLNCVSWDELEQWNARNGKGKIDIAAEAERMGIEPHDPIIGLIGQ